MGRCIFMLFAFFVYRHNFYECKGTTKNRHTQIYADFFVIFNNKIGDSGEQLERFVTDAAKPYYYEGTLYASIEDIPAPTTSVEHTYDDVQCTKLLRNGQILILRGEKVYTLTGQEVR